MHECILRCVHTVANPSEVRRPLDRVAVGVCGCVDTEYCMCFQYVPVDWLDVFGLGLDGECPRPNQRKSNPSTGTYRKETWFMKITWSFDLCLDGERPGRNQRKSNPSTVTYRKQNGCLKIVGAYTNFYYFLKIRAMFLRRMACINEKANVFETEFWDNKCFWNILRRSFEKLKSDELRRRFKSLESSTYSINPMVF